VSAPAAPTLYVVDGYNVLHALFPSLRAAELADKRRWLVDQLAGFAAVRGARICLVFDAHGQRTITCEAVSGTAVEVCYAGGTFSADTLIARRVAEQSPETGVVVVSADHEVQRTASRAGVRRMTPRELGLEIGALEKGLANDENSSRIRTTLEDKVDIETWLSLERLRTEGS
jgi:predicted RNA-binding protein with PIN domain